MRFFPKRNRSLLYCLVIGFIVLVVGFLFRDILNGETTISQAGLYFGPILLTVGWIVGVEVNIANARKQHSINIMLNYSTSQLFKDQDLVLDQHLPTPGARVPTEICQPGRPSETNLAQLMDAIDYRLDFYEFIAVGVLNGDLDEPIIKDVMHGGLIRRVNQCSAYIQHTQDIYGPETWEKLILLSDRWRKTWWQRNGAETTASIIAFIALFIVLACIFS